MPFANPLSLADHFKKHRNEFTATTAADYEALADAFLSKPAAATLLTGTRKNGQRIKFDTVTNELCVTNRHGEILTYYKPTPRQVTGKGGGAGYFQYECGR